MSPRILCLASIPAVLVAALALNVWRDDTAEKSRCHMIPSDPSWPQAAAWSTLNQTVGGNLIATVPIAAPCYNATRNIEKCDALRNTWFFPETHLDHPSSPMAWQFTKNSCNPFTVSPGAQCTLGGHVAYTISAQNPADIQAGVNFARENNIRLVIRNTGHDYLGKSTGSHALAIWIRHLKSQEVIRDYRGDATYTGPALKVGAGVDTIEAFRYADSNGLMVAGGNCPTVGIAGGYAQGGGHGPLVSRVGLAADQVLEWEVVLADGRFVKATPKQNSDLYWRSAAVEVGLKAYANTISTLATFTAFNDGSNTEKIYELMGVLLTNLPALVDAGAQVSFVAGPFGLLLSPAIAPGISKSQLDTLFKPTTDAITRLDLQAGYSSTQYPTLLQSYTAIQSSWNVSDYNLGGRLIPRDLVESNVSAVVGALRQITSQTIVSGVAFNVAQDPNPSSPSAVNPYWRKSLFSLVLGTAVNYTDPAAQKAAQDQVTNRFLPIVERITPSGGAYLNEGDFQAEDFQGPFYGDNYGKLRAVKAKYDPESLFYARTAVGSEEWVEGGEGRLCRL